MHRWIPVFLLSALALSLRGAEPAPAVAADEPGETGGKWNAPDPKKPTWNHQPTGLRFPLNFGDYTLRGVMSYEDSSGDYMVRYVNPAMRARGDVFLERLVKQPANAEETQEAIREALLHAVDDLLDMAEEGRYANVEDQGMLEGRVELWKKDPLPLLVQEIAAMRIDRQDGNEIKNQVRLWYAATVYEGFIVLIRHLRPTATGEEGEKDMKAFTDSITRVLKDPLLRADVRPAMEAFVRDPLTESGQEAAKIVLGYLDNSPMVPVLVPQPPLTQWAEDMEKLVPNSGSQLLRAFVISGALAALDDKDTLSCLTLACQQVVRIYLEVQRLKPVIRHPGLEAMAKAVERGEVATWFEKQMAEAAAKTAK